MWIKWDKVPKFPFALFPLALTHSAVIEEKEWTSNVPTAAERERGWWCERGVTVATHNHHHHHQHHRHHHQHKREKSTSRPRYSALPTIPLTYHPVQPDTFATSLLQSFLFFPAKSRGSCIFFYLYLRLYLYLNLYIFQVHQLVGAPELQFLYWAIGGIGCPLRDSRPSLRTAPWSLHWAHEKWLGAVTWQCSQAVQQVGAQQHKVHQGALHVEPGIK